MMNPQGIIKSSCLTWEINKFSVRSCKVGDSIRSNIFYGGIRDKSQSSWFLLLYPNGYRQKYEGFISLFLFLHACSAEVQVNHELSIVNGALTRCEKREAKSVFSPRGDTRNLKKSFGVYGYPEFISREKVMNVQSNFLRGDTLAIHCRLWGFTCCNHTVETDIPTPMAESSMLKNPLWEQYIYQKFVDVTFNVDGRVFKLHKNYLAAYSAVFSAMFESEMQEGMGHIVFITDCEPEVFEEMVKFIYLGKVDKLKQYHFELLALAEKYALDGLKNACEKSINSDLSIDNAIKTLCWADLHRASWLKCKTLDYIKIYPMQVVTSENWSILVNEPKLLKEVFCVLATLGDDIS